MSLEMCQFRISAHLPSETAPVQGPGRRLRRGECFSPLNTPETFNYELLVLNYNSGLGKIEHPAVVHLLTAQGVRPPTSNMEIIEQHRPPIPQQISQITGTKQKERERETERERERV